MWYKACVAPLRASVTTHESGAQPYTLVELAGEADVLDTEALQGVLETQARKRPGLLVIEMSGLQFMDSAALHAILRAHRMLVRDGGRLVLVSPHDTVARVLQMTEVDRIVPVYASVAEAVAR